MRTRAVSRLTTLYLLRLRLLVEQPDRTPLLGEEVQVIGHAGLADSPDWLQHDQVLGLLEKAQPDGNIPDEEKRELISAALSGYAGLDAYIRLTLQGRAEALTESHRGIRQAVSLKVRGLTVKPQTPPDLLGLLVLQPMVEEGGGERGERR
jgi:hypothetical protein